MKITKFIISLVFLIALTTSSHAETTVTPEVGFVLNTLLFLMGGFLVMWMAAGLPFGKAKMTNMIRLYQAKS